jgi:hypothetical protein
MAMRTAQYDRRPARANKLKSSDLWELAICLPGGGKRYCQRLQSDRASKSRQDRKDLAASMRFLNEI